MNVLSLFDGMSCGQQALEQARLKVDNYFASEIDKYAIQVTMANYPNTKQLGSVVNVDGYKLPKIDLLIGGSPCQSFSFAGKRKGMATTDEQEILTLKHYLQLKKEGFEFEGQSYLFWEFMRLLYEVKPKYFLLENVEMGEKWERVLTQAIGVNALHINSALVSAQNRKRIYFTNIGMEAAGLFGYPVSIIQKPKDRKILLKDILESEVDEKYFLSERIIAGFERHKERHDIKGTGFGYTIKNKDDKSNSLRANAALCPTDNMLIVYNNKRLNETIEKHKENLEHGTLIDSYNKEIHKDKSITISTRVNASSCTHIMDNTNAVEVRNIIQHIIPEIVSVRKYEVNIPALQDCLKQHKKLNNKEIASALNVPKTMVEHWFRTDTYFSIPDKNIWLKLKNLLEISTNEFDVSILVFEEKESVYEKKNRVYDENGIAPTLTSTSADERILVREVKQLSTNNKSNGGTQPYQQDRIYDVNGISPALNTDGRTHAVKVKALNENQQKKFNPNINADKANTLTLAQGRAGSSEEYMDAVSKIAKLTSRIRRLTPLECMRLQTVDDNYKMPVSDSQRYKMLGNGWTIEVISHIFKYIK